MSGAGENPAYQRIWQTVLKIPPGKVSSYGQIADLAGLPGRARLVGKALGAAPSDQPLPWYRVLRANGQIAFPAGSRHAQIQRERLLAEGVLVKGQRVALKTFGWQPNLAELVFDLSY